jgi:prefoldin subunit 5
MIKMRSYIFLLIALFSFPVFSTEFLSEIEGFQCPKATNDEVFSQSGWLDISGLSDAEIRKLVERETRKIITNEAYIPAGSTAELESGIRRLKSNIENEWQTNLDFLSNQWRKSVVAFESAQREVKQVELYNSQIEKHNEIIEKLKLQKDTLRKLFQEKVSSVGRKVFVASSALVRGDVLVDTAPTDIETALNQRAAEQVIENFSNRKIEVFDRVTQNIITQSTSRIKTSGRYVIASQFPTQIGGLEGIYTRTHTLATIQYFPFEDDLEPGIARVNRVKRALNDSKVEFKSNYWLEDDVMSINSFFGESIPKPERQKLQAWIQYELRNIEQDNNAVEETLSLYYESLNKNLDNIDQEISKIRTKIREYQRSRDGLRGVSDIEEDEMLKVQQCYEDFIKNKSILTFSKGYVIGGTKKVTETFEEATGYALSRNEVLQGNYSSTILVSNNKLASEMETKTIEWNANKSKLKIVYLSIESAGLFTQNSALVAIRHQLVNSGKKMNVKPVRERVFEKPDFLEEF